MCIRDSCWNTPARIGWRRNNFFISARSPRHACWTMPQVWHSITICGLVNAGVSSPYPRGQPPRGFSLMYTLYSDQRSGNSYKVRLALARLGIPFTLVEVDILQGASRTPEFLAKNPNGHVPLLEVAPNRYLAESNAILWYVAGGTTLAPEDRIDRAEAMQWMFFEQCSKNIHCMASARSMRSSGANVVPPATYQRMAFDSAR